MLTFLFHYKYISLNKSSSPAGFCFCLFFILMYLTFQSRSNLSCSIAFQCTLFFQVFFLIVQLGGSAVRTCFVVTYAHAGRRMYGFLAEQTLGLLSEPEGADASTSRLPPVTELTFAHSWISRKTAENWRGWEVLTEANEFNSSLMCYIRIHLPAVHLSLWFFSSLLRIASERHTNNTLHLIYGLIQTASLSLLRVPGSP